MSTWRTTMDRRLGPWRVAARLARREVRRHWARSALVVLIIALPVLGTQAAAMQTLAFQLPDRWQPTGPIEVPGLQRDDPQSAGANRRVGFDPRLGRPEDSRAERVETGFEVVDWADAAAGHGRGPDDLVRVTVVGFVPDASAVPLTRGEHPRTRHEVVVSPQLAERAGVGVGDRVELIATGVALDVVGIARPGAARTAVAWAGPPPAGADPADPTADWVVEALMEVRPAGSPFVSIEVYALFWFPRQTPPPTVAPAAPLTNPVPDDPATLLIAAVGAAIAVGFVATVCSAAFAIGARRQLRGLGTLAATGAAPGDLVRAVLLQGTTLGLVATVGATVLTFVGRIALLAVLDDRWVVPWALERVLAVAVLGVAAGTLSALVPALTASRIPTLSALAGRVPGHRGRLRSPYVGAGLVLVGLGVLSVSAGTSDRRDTVGAAGAAVGVLLVMAGAVALSPGVVALVAGLCARRGGTTRLAGRSLARSGSRSAAVVASTAVAVALPIVLIVWGARTDALQSRPPGPISAERSDAAWRTTGVATIQGFGANSDVDGAIAEVADLMGPRAVTARAVVTIDERGTTQALAVDVDALRRATGADPVVEALAAGEVVTLEGATDWALGDGEEPIAGTAVDLTGRPVREVHGDEVSDLVVRLLEWGSARLVSAEVAAGTTTDHGALVVRPGALSSTEADRLQDLSTDGEEIPTRAELVELTASDPVQSGLEVIATGPDVHDPGQWRPPVELFVVLGAILLALAVIGTASALAAADGRSDELILAAVGAPPAAVHRRRALEALLTAAGATALGAGLGSVATLVVIHHPFVREPGWQPGFTFPFLAVGATAAGIVVTVGAVTWLALGAGRLRGRHDLALIDG